MNCITVKFEKQGEKYSQSVTFPDGKCVTEKDIEMKKQWHSPETWKWSKPLHEYSREELTKEETTSPMFCWVNKTATIWQHWNPTRRTTKPTRKF